ncbi:LysR substrate-binding domain-containing protein [Kocuria sp. ZOR0020]|uniref:LysR substrate-binding domain-containing protein n=1 Tax=Kocuria sp. ZOR0020 TaxID=1339234 RepID=UPI000AFA47FA|nr:LysR substrate-binding domain-containing protein [Kocuria sp. ZOR0020]
MAPTPAGEAFVQRGRLMMAQADDLLQELRHQRDGESRRIRLASNTSAMDALTEFLASTMSRFPDLHVALEETTSTEVARRVRDGGADLGVVSVPPRDPGLTVQQLWSDPLVVVCAPQLLGGAVSDDNDDAAGAPFESVIRGPMIGLTEGVPLQSYIDEHLSQRGVTTDYRVRLPTPGAVYAVASTGAGAAILPQGTARRLGAPDKLVHPIAQPWAQRQALLLTRADHKGSPIQSSFVEAMLRYRQELVD